MDATYQAQPAQTTDNAYERKAWFKAVKWVLKLFVRKPEHIYLGEKVAPGGIILSNHVGPHGPWALELYADVPLRLWGTHEMNENLKTAYTYQTNIYYHQKKHWNLFLARVACLLITPLTYMYYKGIYLISSYQDARLKKTLQESLHTLRQGHSVVVFPEKSDNGYFDVLTGFYPGVVLFFQYCMRHDLDVPVHVAYYRRKTRQYIFDKPVFISELLALGLSRETLAQKLCDRCNELGKMEIS